MGSPREDFAVRLNEACDHIGLPPKHHGRQVAVAKLFGVSQKGARKWLEGEAMPATWRMSEFASKLNCSGEWLFSGRGDPRGSDLGPGPSTGRLVPLILWHDVPAFMKSTAETQHAVRPMLPCPIEVGAGAFALRVTSAAMEPMIREGEIIYVDPDVTPQGGHYVVAVLGERVLLRRLEIDGGQRFLRALNPSWPNPTTPMKHGDRLAGVVVFRGEQLV